MSYAAAVLCIISISIGSYISGRNYIETNRLVEHSYEVIVQLELIHFTVVEAETFTRGYVITQDTSFIRSYNESRNALDTAIQRVRQVTSSDEELTKQLQELFPLIDQRIALLDSSFMLMKMRGMDAARAFVAAGKGIAIMEQIRTEIDGIKQFEYHRLRERSDNQQKSLGDTLTASGIMLMFIVLLLSIVFFVIQKDLSGRRKSEQALRNAYHELDDLYDNAPCGYHSLGPDGTIIRMNATELQWLGYTRDEIIGKRNFRSLLTNESAELFEKEFPRFKESGHVRDLEFEMQRSDGTTLWVLLNASAVYDINGAMMQTRSTVTDITERKRIDGELERHRHSLEETNKELESFTYSVSHDLRAPLRHINGYVDLLKLKFGSELNGQLLHYFSVIAESSRRMGDLIDDLLIFSRVGKTSLTFETVNLQKIVEEMIARFTMETGSRNIHWNVEQLPPLYADRSMIELVFQNLIGNAIKYTKTRDTSVITIGCSGVNGSMSYFVRDNGVGFDMQYHDKMFGVFQRLHNAEEYEGTGIGLANVHRIITRHGGRVWAESVEGESAVFYFSIPQQNGGTV